MSASLPHFTYHPDPIRSGAVRAGGEICVSCGRSRGFVYIGPIYSLHDVIDAVCPWCIADGSAAAKLDISFADATPLQMEGVPPQIVDEVHRRTPSFESWEQERWLAHCNDACEFHGDATQGDLLALQHEEKMDFLVEYRLSEPQWRHLVAHYVPRGDPSIYKFVCRHCRTMLLGMDYR